jgi:hypothetical protein
MVNNFLIAIKFGVRTRGADFFKNYKKSNLFLNIKALKYNCKRILRCFASLLKGRKAV